MFNKLLNEANKNCGVFKSSKIKTRFFYFYVLINQNLGTKKLRTSPFLLKYQNFLEEKPVDNWLFHTLLDPSIPSPHNFHSGFTPTLNIQPIPLRVMPMLCPP
jgi:hypothetical protein